MGTGWGLGCEGQHVLEKLRCGLPPEAPEYLILFPSTHSGSSLPVVIVFVLVCSLKDTNLLQGVLMNPSWGSLPDIPKLSITLEGQGGPHLCSILGIELGPGPI